MVKVIHSTQIVKVLFFSIYVPSMQQSAPLLQLLPEIPGLQLFLPHLRVPEQSESVSQSPSPRLHCFEGVQHSQLVEGTPLHAAGFGAAVVSNRK